MDRVRRVNGLDPPYTPAQLSTWVYLPTLVLEFLFFASPLLPLAASVPCSVVYFISAAASAYYGYTAMYIDPADPRLPCEGSQHSTENGAHGHEHTANAGLWDPNEPTKQCWLCDVQVGEKSMHCKFCNKCVDHFDHHCMCKFKVQYQKNSMMYDTDACTCTCVLVQVQHSNILHTVSRRMSLSLSYE
jgi:hypothetical protein